MTQEYEFHQPNEAGIPVDLNEQEYLDFNLTLARRMGALRLQKPMLFLFAVYLAVDVISLIKEFVDTGRISWTLLIIAAVTLACGCLVLTVMPARIRKTAKASFLMGNQNGYYGELTVTPHAVMKNIGDETITVPLDEHSIYLEDKGFMAFTAQGQSRSIVLPARCVTPQMATAIREAVFAPTARIQRRVFARMDAAAPAAIPRRDFPAPPQTLYTLDFAYTEQEAAKLFKDVAMKQYFQSLPTVSAMAIMAGLLLTILQEQVFWFPLISLGIIFGYLLLLLLQARARGKNPVATENRTHVTLTDRGVELRISPTGQRISFGWQGVERAVERADCVEFFYSGNNLLRIPKRAIDDFDELKRIVDTHVRAVKK